MSDDLASWRLLDVLNALAAHYGAVSYRCTDAVDRWVAMCPVCEDTSIGWPLVITEPREGSAVVMRCSNGCTSADIIAQLSVPAAAAHRIRDLKHQLALVILTAKGIDLIAGYALHQWQRLEEENERLHAALKSRPRTAEPPAGVSPGRS